VAEGRYGPVREWMRACLDWLGEHPARRLPFGPDGDSVDVIREAARITIASVERTDDE
jgi:hypothetical protein